MTVGTATLVFAAAPYLNAVPLTQFLAAPALPPVRVHHELPSHLLALLQSRRADAALVPVVTYFANPDLQFVPTVAVGADGPVHSVLLECNLPLDQIRTVQTDPASKTSNALAELLLRERYAVRAEFIPAYDNYPCDARVIIGDRALLTTRRQNAQYYDLAAEWKALTGLPFVFAVWAYQANHPHAQLICDLAQTAKQAGLAALPQLAATEARRRRIPEQLCQRYLSTSINYHLDPPQLVSLDLFRTKLIAMQAEAAQSHA